MNMMKRKTVVELNQFMNTWNPYEPEKEENNGIAE